MISVLECVTEDPVCDICVRMCIVGTRIEISKQSRNSDIKFMVQGSNRGMGKQILD